MSEGKISEDEAWTIKAFMHALDKVREDRMKEAEDDIKESPLTESVSDEDYEAAMDNPIMVPAVRQSIIDKLYTGNTDLLTAREKMCMININKILMIMYRLWVTVLLIS